jgi:hypothetical protein
MGNWLTSVSDHELKTFLNLDAWVVLHFLKFCGKLCLFTAVFGMIVLWPTYVTSETDQADVHGITLYTMAHLDAGSARLWVPTLCTWLYASVTVRLMKLAYQEFVDQRLLFLMRDDSHVKPQKRFSVMVQNLPRHLITSSRQLQDMFEELFPGKVHSASLVQPLPALEMAVRTRENILTALELATASYQASGMQTRPSVRLINAPAEDKDASARLLPAPPKVVVKGVCSGVCCLVGEQKDALDYYNIQLTEINMAIRRLRGEVTGEGLSSSPPPSPSPSSLLSSGYAPPPPQQQQLPPSDTSSVHSSDSSLIGLDSNECERLSNASAMSEEGVALKPPSKPPTPGGPGPDSDTSLLQDITGSAPMQAISGWAAMAVQGSALYDGNSVATTTGFVTFSCRTAWLTAHRLGTLSDVFPDLCILPAPAPEDLLWGNLLHSTRHTHQGQMLSSSVFRLGLVFWGSLISFVTAMSNLGTLEEYLPFIEDLDDVSYSLLAGILPVTLMALLLASVPLVISYVVIRLDRLSSTSAVHLKVFQWAFAYLLANMFVSIISGSIIRSLEDFADSPKLVLSFLADSFPATSVLFCNYVISVTLIAGPNELLQILPLLEFTYYTRLNREAYLTKRKLFADNGPLCKKHYPFGGYLPQYVFVMTIVLFFSVISPLVPLVCLFFFVSRYYVLRHQFLYVYTPQYSLGGRFWFDMHHYTMLALVLFTVTMIAYTLLKQGFLQGLAMLPLPPLVWYQWGRMDETFGKLTQDIAYAKAMQDHAPQDTSSDGCGDSSTPQDSSCGKEGSSDVDRDCTLFSSNYYTHPALLAPIDASPLPYRMHNQPLLAPSKQRGGCPCCSLISREVTAQYLLPLQESGGEEGVAPLVDVDFLDNSMVETDIETDQSKSDRLKYTIDYSY